MLSYEGGTTIDENGLAALASSRRGGFGSANFSGIRKIGVHFGVRFRHLPPKLLIHRRGSGVGGAGRNRTADRAFAELGLTTWRPRRKLGKADVAKNPAVAQVPKMNYTSGCLVFAQVAKGLGGI